MCKLSDYYVTEKVVIVITKDNIGQAKTSEFGALRMMQQDIMGHKVGTYEKIDWLQQTLTMLISGMDFLSTNRIREWNESLEDDIKDVNEDLPPGSQRKGIFRDPLYAAGEIQKTESKKNVEVVGTKKIDDANWVRHKEDVQSLKHLKLSFSVYKKGSDNLEWQLQPCT